MRIVASYPEECIGVGTNVTFVTIDDILYAKKSTLQLSDGKVIKSRNGVLWVEEKCTADVDFSVGSAMGITISLPISVSAFLNIEK